MNIANFCKYEKNLKFTNIRQLKSQISQKDPFLFLIIFINQ